MNKELRLKIFKDSLNDINLSRKSLINTINPHSYILSKNDKIFQESLLNSDILLPDGIGIVYALKLLENILIKKISGYDLFIYLMRYSQNNNKKVMFFGSTNEVLHLIKKRAEREFPNANVHTFSPPFKPEFTELENKELIKAVNDAEPDILFIGMTAPKQEKWAYQNFNYIQATTVCSIGAVFDFYAGTVKRSSKFWINLGLEWLPRFLKEPKRLWKRNLISAPLFIIEVLSLKVFKKGIF